MFAIPEHFVHRTIEVHGAAGRAWLDRLPGILNTCTEQWGITLGPPFPRLSYHYAAPATLADGTAAVLKACTPTGEFARERAAMELFDGGGAARLLGSDAALEVMLIERLEPGTLLSAVEDDDEATTIAATVMQQLWRPAPEVHPFPTVADWGAGFDRLRQRFNGGSGPLPAGLVERAEALFRELSDSMAESMLLHGDLNYGNVLAAQRQPWLAIDPKGLVGEPAYETGVLLRDPQDKILAAPQPGRLLARRLDRLAEVLGMDRERLLGWGLAQAVLSAWWTIEDHGHGWEPTIACAELLAAIRI